MENKIKIEGVEEKEFEVEEKLNLEETVVPCEEMEDLKI
jgi:hypothetical protein